MQKQYSAKKPSAGNLANPPCEFYPRVINLDHAELEPLEKGLKHIFPLIATENIKEKIVVHLAVAKPSYPTDTVNRLSNIIHTTPIPVLRTKQKNTVVHLRKKVKENNTIVTEADKGNTVVLIDQADYHAKMLNCLQDTDATLDPTFSFNVHNENIRKPINDNRYILDKEPMKRLF